MKFHKENPTKAPLIGSSSEDEEDANGNTTNPGRWIGVCNARMQHRVWWQGLP